MTPDEANRARLQQIAAESAETDEVRCECVYGAYVVHFAISSLEVQHLGTAGLWARYFAPAFEALHVPAPVVADATTEGSLVGVGGHP